MASQNVWNLSLFEHFFKGFSLYFEARIWIRIRIRVYVLLTTLLFMNKKILSFRPALQVICFLFAIKIYRGPSYRFLLKCSQNGSSIKQTGSCLQNKSSHKGIEGRETYMALGPSQPPNIFSPVSMAMSDIPCL
jgi:hypothetical protein